MTKKEICLKNKSFAYYSGFGGLELKKIEYGINDYIYCISGAWCSKKSYHKLKVYYGLSGAYLKLYGYKISLDNCIGMEV
jgi:hypothetical protein